MFSNPVLFSDTGIIYPVRTENKDDFFFRQRKDDAYLFFFFHRSISSATPINTHAAPIPDSSSTAVVGSGPRSAPETPAAGQDAQTETAQGTSQEGTAPSETPQAETAAQESAPGTPSEGGTTAKPAEKKESLLHIIYRTHGVDGILEILRRVFSYLGSFFGDMMKSLVIEELYLDIGCAKKDAAETAIYYGEVCAALYPMLGALASKCKIKKYDINVYPDYLARFGRASFFVKFHVYPIYLMGVTVVLVCRMVFKVLLRMLVKILLPKKDKNAEGKNKKNRKGR